MRFDDIDEGVAGPKNCWPGHRKIGTQPGTGKNAGQRVNKCKRIGEEIDPADVGEYDREGDMAQSQLQTAEDAAAELRSILDADENLPEWVQSKITKAVDYLDTARDYMKSEKKGVAEGAASTSNLDSVFNEHDFYRLEHIWPALEAGDKKEALRQINHYLNKGKNRAWWGDLQALDISIDPDNVENSQVVWSKPIQQGAAEGTSALGQAVKEVGWGRRSSYYNPMDQERREQDAMDYSKRAFKRAELQHELGHEDDPNFERNLRQQQIDRDRGPWYIRIDGKIYRQKGEPKSFDWKRGANNYALAMVKNNPGLQGRIMLTKSAEDK